MISCMTAALLFSGCVSSRKQNEEKKRKEVEKKLKTPFEKPAVIEIKKKNPVKQKVVIPPKKVPKAPPAKKINSPKPVPKPVPPQPKALNRCYINADASPFLKPESFVMCWQISGPYPASASIIKAEGPAIIHHEFVQNEKNLNGFDQIPGGNKWVTLPAPLKGPMGRVNLDPLWKKANGPSAAYAVTSLFCPKEMKNLTLKTGSSDYLKIWINGKLEQTFNREKRTGKFDQDSVKGVYLKKGINYIVVKTLCFSAPWQFYLRFADSKGLPIAILPSVSR